MRLLILLAMLTLVPVGTAYAQLYCQAPQQLWDDAGNQHSTTGSWCFYLVPEEAPEATPTPQPTSTPVISQRTPTSTALPDSGQRVVPDQYRTITSALVGIQPGQTVLVKAGVYRELVTVRVRGVTILGELDSGSGQRAWIDGQCERVHGVYVVADDVTIRGLGIRDTTEAAVLIGSERATSRAHIDGNSIENYNCLQTGDQYAAGVAAWYAGSGHRVTGNTITSGGPKGNGIWFKSNTAQPSGGGHLISGNTITGGYDGIGGEEEGSPRGGFDRNTIITGNTVRDCADDGIQVEGGGQNIVVEDNTVTDCGVGFAVATALTGPLTLRRNTVTLTKLGTAYGMMACYKVGRSSTATVYIQDSVCVADGTQFGANVGKGIQQTNSGIGGLVVERNTWNVTAYVYELTSMPLVGSRFDYNCFTFSDPTRFVQWPTGHYNTLGAFSLATGHERNGRTPC